MNKLEKWLGDERGRVTHLANAIGITHSAVLQWDRIPAERVLDVERVTGISRHELRPDIFGPAPQPERRAEGRA